MLDSALAWSHSKSKMVAWLIWLAVISPNRPPDRQKLLAPLLAHGVAIEPLELLDRVRDRLAGRRNGEDRIAVGAADRLGHDLVDDTEAGEVLRGDLHAGRGFLCLGGVAPQDRGGALRRDHAVEGVLQHQHAVGGRDRDRAARAADPDDHRDVGHAELEAGLGRARDRFRLAALLGADARIGALGVDQRQNRDAETVSHLHQSNRLAIALRPRHAEIVLEPLLGGRALLVADDADALAAEAAEAADDRLVVAELAVAGERYEVGDQRAYVVEAARPVGVARDLRLLPGREAGIEVLERLGGLRLQPADLLPDCRRALGGLDGAQFVKLSLDLGNRLRKVEIAAHRPLVACEGAPPRPGAKSLQGGCKSRDGGPPAVAGSADFLYICAGQGDHQ